MLPVIRNVRRGLPGLKMVSCADSKNISLCLILVDILPTKLCAVDRNDIFGACLGDSGGPLVVLKRSEDNRCKWNSKEGNG